MPTLLFVVDARQRVHAVRAQREWLAVASAVARRSARSSATKPALDHRLVARAARSSAAAPCPRTSAAAPPSRCPSSRASRSSTNRAQLVRLAIPREPDALAVVGGNIDGRARHQLPRGVLDQLRGNRQRVSAAPCARRAAACTRSESTSACHDASMMLSATPTVPHVSSPSPEVMSTRVLAAGALRLVEDADLVVEQRHLAQVGVEVLERLAQRVVERVHRPVARRRGVLARCP